MGAMLLKIDLEKTYDKIEWSFVERMLLLVSSKLEKVDNELYYY